MRPCTLSFPNFPGGVKAVCGDYPVAEDPARPEGRAINLRVAVLKARSDSPAPDPVFFFAGGPGQSAVDAYPSMAASLEPLRRERDIVLVDQRGTGASNPLNCQEDEPRLDREYSQEERRRFLQTCLASLDADTRFYTTSIAVGDFDQVRQALGYERINIIGVSYGTRVAQVYLRRFPDAVRSVVLDGVVPTDLVLGSEHAVNLDQALDKLFTRCRQKEGCNSRFPNLAADLRAFKQQADLNPVMVKLPSTRTGKMVEIKVTRNVLALVVRLLAYTPETQALLPLMLHEAAADGNLNRLASQALLVLEGLEQAISQGLELSVMCAEDVPHFSDARRFDDTLLGNALMDYTRDHCEIWPHGDAPDDFHQPFTSLAPALLLSGEYDPVTPPEYGERALRQFANGRHLIVAGQGHNVAGRGCVPTLIHHFLRSGHVENLDTDCLQQMGDTPFFTTLLGPEP